MSALTLATAQAIIAGAMAERAKGNPTFFQSVSVVLMGVSP